MDPSIQKVAVIGAGISGVCSAVHLLRRGLSVTVFERSDDVGGLWRYDPRPAPDPAYPNTIPSVGDYAAAATTLYATPPPEEDEKDSEAVELAHAPASACYKGLTGNVTTPLIQNSLLNWPEGTAAFVTHHTHHNYIKSIVQEYGIHQIIEFHTRVEEVKKHGNLWHLRTATLTKTPQGCELHEKYWTFDAVVVASGHFNVPHIPDIPGLHQWKHRWPDRILHSKSYRDPIIFKDQTLLLIGAGVSSCDIAKECGPHAKHIYQSSRGGALDLPTSFLPPNALRIPSIKRFDSFPAHTAPLDSATSPIPATVTLSTSNADELPCPIHTVILCTGYLRSYPFLRHLHADHLPASLASPETLVTSEGVTLHNCHKDIFYIPDPTLAFVGAKTHAATFTLFDFQAQVVARVWAGLAKLPSERVMREEYEGRVREKGVGGRDFHSFRGVGEEEGYVEGLVEWMNCELKEGEERMKGHTEEWHKERVRTWERRKLFFEPGKWGKEKKGGEGGDLWSGC
ncbi:MAG: hypothetical protein Q9227_003466 [Pyrenula ochraceoflavens]